MFDIDENRIIVTDLSEITENYEILHFDEFPILYSGTNTYGNKIVGSLVCEDEESYESVRYFHSIVSNQIFYKFIYREITYLQLLRACSNIYVLDKDLNDQIIQQYLVPLELIPNDYLPLESAYCPEIEYKFGTDYILSLNGKLASMHLAIPQQLSKIQTSFEAVLLQTTNIIEALHLTPKIRLKPYSEGSFKISLNLKLENDQNLFISENEIHQLISSLVKYNIDDFPKEAEKILENGIVEDSNLFKIKEGIKIVFEKGGIVFSDEIEKKISQDVIQNYGRYEKIFENLGEDYREMEILNRDGVSNSIVPISLINAEKVQKIENTIELIDEKQGSVEKDTELQEYRILVYNLNTDSRKGNAYIQDPENPDIMHKPKIYILGDNELKGSKYTESLHLNKWILTSGKATRVNGKFKQIEIFGEFE